MLHERLLKMILLSRTTRVVQFVGPHLDRALVWQRLNERPENIPETEIAPLTGNQIPYRDWFHRIVFEGKWWESGAIAHMVIGEEGGLSNVLNEVTGFQGPILRFDTFFWLLPASERTLVVRQIFERANSVPLDEGVRSYLARKYVSFVSHFERKVGLLNNADRAIEIYTAAAADFVKNAAEYRNVYDNKTSQTEIQTQSQTRQEAKDLLGSIFQFNPSPELLRKAFEWWNQQLSPGAPVRKRRAALKPGQRVKLVSDRELNSLRWVLKHIPKGGVTRDERRRLHQYVLALIERRYQREDDPVARFMSDLLVYMNVKVTSPEARETTILKFLEFAVLYSNLPKGLQKQRLKPVQKYLAEVTAASREMAVLEGPHYEALSRQMSRELVQWTFKQTVSLTDDEKQEIEKSVAAHFDAWTHDGILSALTRYAGFQDDEGRRSVERLLVQLARSQVLGERFYNVPRYEWPNDNGKVREWFGRLIYMIQSGYSAEISLIAEEAGLSARYRDVWHDLLTHLELHPAEPESWEPQIRKIFSGKEALQFFPDFMSIFQNIEARLAAGDAISAADVADWRERLNRLNLARVFPHWPEVLINLQQILFVQRMQRDMPTSGRFSITEDPVDFIRSGERPYYTCQRINEPTGFNKNGMPVTRVRHGQFFLGRVDVGDKPEMRSVLEIARSARDQEKVLLVERFYSSGLVPGRSFQQAIIDWAISTKEIRYIAMSGASFGNEVTSLIDLEFLPTDAPVYRDTKWPGRQAVLDLEKYQRMSGQIPSMDEIRAGYGHHSPSQSALMQLLPRAWRWIGIPSLVWLEELTHLVVSHGRGSGTEFVRQLSGLFDGQVQTSGRRPLWTAAAGPAVSLATGALLLNSDWWVVGALTLARVAADLLLYFNNPQHELRAFQTAA
jgi:hypothetical protein